jgi:hypothetical protein
MNPSIDTFKPPPRRLAEIRSGIILNVICSKLLTLRWAHLSLILKAMDAIVGNLCRFPALPSGGLKNKVCVMTANHVTPFEAFKSFVEFYPKLGAMIAFGTMAAAARMIPTSSAAISDAPQIAKRPQLVSTANVSSHRRRSTAHKKTPRKTSKRATGRRKAA